MRELSCFKICSSTVLPFLKQDPALRHIKRRQFEPHRFTQLQGTGFFPVPPATMSMQQVPVGELRSKQLAAENLNYLGVEANGVFDRHVRISGSDTVTRTVCSKWAES